MRALVQRVRSARVVVDGDVAGRIEQGLLVYVGVATWDTPADARRVAEKVAHLRIFEDDRGKLNRSLQDVRGGVLAISNFTLLGDVRKGRRPAFVDAAGGARAEALFEEFVSELKRLERPVATGVFGAHMDIDSAADGPVNLIVEFPDPPAGDTGPQHSAGGG